MCMMIRCIHPCTYEIYVYSYVCSRLSSKLLRLDQRLVSAPCMSKLAFSEMRLMEASVHERVYFERTGCETVEATLSECFEAWKALSFIPENITPVFQMSDTEFARPFKQAVEQYEQYFEQSLAEDVHAEAHEAEGTGVEKR